MHPAVPSVAMTADPRALPPDLVARARALADGEFEVAAARDAATVVLLRDAPEFGVEVYLLRRVASMAFAAGMYVFPGGSVDPRDADADIGWAGPAPAQWGRWFDADEPLARARGGRVFHPRRAAGPGAGVRGGARDVRGVRRHARRSVARRGARRRLGRRV